MVRMLNAILVLLLSVCVLLTGVHQSIAAAAERQVTILYGHNIHGQLDEAG